MFVTAKKIIIQTKCSKVSELLHDLFVTSQENHSTKMLMSRKNNGSFKFFVYIVPHNVSFHGNKKKRHNPKCQYHSNTRLTASNKKISPAAFSFSMFSPVANVWRLVRLCSCSTTRLIQTIAAFHCST